EPFCPTSACTFARSARTSSYATSFPRDCSIAPKRWFRRIFLAINPDLHAWPAWLRWSAGVAIAKAPVTYRIWPASVDKERRFSQPPSDQERWFQLLSPQPRKRWQCRAPERPFHRKYHRL